MAGEVVTHAGGCHCRAVRFKVRTTADLHVYDCNCTICTMKHNIHFIVPEKDFELVSGADVLTTYTFNTHKAKHMFCSVCGVQSFYKPRSNPDGYGVNPNCLDQSTVGKITIEKYNGQNWEKSYEDELKKETSIQSRSRTE